MHCDVARSPRLSDLVGISIKICGWQGERKGLQGCEKEMLPCEPVSRQASMLCTSADA